MKQIQVNETTCQVDSNIVYCIISTRYQTITKCSGMILEITPLVSEESETKNAG